MNDHIADPNETMPEAAAEGNDHNMRPAIDAATEHARKALGTIKRSAAKGLDGWIDYGKALKEGREMFDSDDQFGKWIKDNDLDVIGKFGAKVQRTNPHERAASIWSAQEPENFDKMRKANPTVLTVRGLHAKWKAHIRKTVAESALAEELDDDVLNNEIGALSDITGIPEDVLRAETERQKRKAEAAAAAAAKGEDDPAPKPDAGGAAPVDLDKLRAEIRAEVEAEMELEAADEPVKDSIAPVLATALVGVLRTEVTLIVADAIEFCKTGGSYSGTDYDHESRGVNFVTAGTAKDGKSYRATVGKLQAVVDGADMNGQVDDIIVNLTMNGNVLPGNANPPSIIADMLADDFSAGVIAGVRTMSMSRAEAAE